MPTDGLRQNECYLASGDAAVRQSWPTQEVFVTGQTPDDPGSLAERIDFLFRTVLFQPQRRESNGNIRPRPYTYVEAAAAINRAAGERIVTGQALSYLRRGKRGAGGRASHRIIRAIERFFGVPEGYLDGGLQGREVDDHIDVVAALRNDKIRAIVAQIQDLPPGMQLALLRVATETRALTGLPPVRHGIP